MAEENKETPMLDPIAYRSDYRPEDIKEEFRDDPNLPWVWPLKANENFNEYGDDSNPSWQWYRGWLNPKYEWEWVANSIIDYNPNITTSDLDPNYLFWRAVQETKNKEDNYLAKRNDNIASALYNEWKVTKADIANYLAQQNWWMNSTEADRYNTIESIWKRIWQIKPQEKEEVDTSKMKSDLSEDTAWTIYGKVTAQEWDATEWINTLEDKNSVFKAMEVARVAAVEEMLNMWVDSLAAMQYSWTNPYNETNWRDFRKYYPEMAAQVDQKVKEMNSQDVVNAIASGKTITTTADKTDVSWQATSYAVNNASGSTTATQLLQWINSILESNDTAKSAEELMGSIEKDMATLKNRMKNLKSEVTAQFKWDVPDYLVNAAMSNRSQEIQNQLSILEDRYNAAYNRYKTELSHAEWEAEYNLKKDNLELDWYKAKNSSTTTTTTTDSDYTRTERNNNPTAMIVEKVEALWWVLWVDYEIWDPFIWKDNNWNPHTYYTAKLIWDPVEKTIELLDRALANWNPNIFWWWTYASKLWLTNDFWKNASDEQKRDTIYRMLQQEWWNMDNMSYYVNNPWVQWKSDTSWYWYMWFDYWYDPALDSLFQQYSKSAKLWASSKAYQDIKNTFWYNDSQIWEMFRNWQKQKQNEWNQAWIDVLDDMAALWINLENAWRIKNWELDINWTVWYDPLWMEILSWPLNASLDKLIAELKLQKMVTARSNNVSFWQVTEAEWKMIWDAATTLKQATWLWSTDKDFTNAYKDLLNAVWKATFHEDYSDGQWQQFVKDKQAWRTNVNIAILTNNTAWVRQSTTTADDAVDKTFQQAWKSWWAWWVPSMSQL